MSDDYNKGRIDELDRRIDRISNRLDEHISACSVRFFILVGLVTAATAIISTVIEFH